MRKSKAVKDALLALEQCRHYPVGHSMSPDVRREYDAQIRDDRERILQELWDKAVESTKEKR